MKIELSAIYLIITYLCITVFCWQYIIQLFFLILSKINYFHLDMYLKFDSSIQKNAASRTVTLSLPSSLLSSSAPLSALFFCISLSLSPSLAFLSTYTSASAKRLLRFASWLVWCIYETANHEQMAINFCILIPA